MIKVRNVNDALPEGCRLMKEFGQRRGSRNGPVLVFPEPFITEYERPFERVLFSSVRDCNPFFHLMEALWMLAGRNDVASVEKYNSNIATYSDNGIVFNGAYGNRWRFRFGLDQITWIINRLRKDPEDRRAVLQMWDARVDPRVCDENGKDVPCNLVATFQVSVAGSLDMTVFNRSNDLIWGAYGANVVHFSVLQEIIAHSIGLPMGKYWQISANTHVYERHWPLMEKLAETEAFADSFIPRQNYYADGSARRVELMDFCTEPLHGLTMFLEDCEDIFAREHFVPRTGFFKHIVLPMKLAWEAHRDGKDTSMLSAMPMESDWFRAANEWFARRVK